MGARTVDYPDIYFTPEQLKFTNLHRYDTVALVLVLPVQNTFFSFFSFLFFLFFFLFSLVLCYRTHLEP